MHPETEICSIRRGGEGRPGPRADFVFSFSFFVDHPIAHGRVLLSSSYHARYIVVWILIRFTDDWSIIGLDRFLYFPFLFFFVVSKTSISIDDPAAHDLISKFVWISDSVEARWVRDPTQPGPGIRI